MPKKIQLLLIIAFISQTSIAQNFKKAFHALDNENYTSARVIFSPAVKNADTKAIGEYGMAAVYRGTSLRIEDNYRAYASIISAKKHYKDLDAKLKKKYSKQINEDKIDAELYMIDVSLFKMVVEIDNVKAYQKHIDNCKESRFHQKAIDLRNVKAYKAAMEFNTITAYKDFCDNYPESVQFVQAQTIMYTMAWSECEAIDKISNYKEFISKYPEAPQVYSAKEKIRKFDYQTALDIDTQTAFTAFIAKYPNSEEAKTLKGQGSKSAYANVVKFNSIPVCERFLFEYPNTDYSARVTAIRDSLAYNDATEKNTTEGYNAFIDNYPNAIQVPLVMDKLGKLLYSKEELQVKRAKFAIKHQKISSIKVYANNENSKIINEKRYDIFGNCTYDYEYILDDYNEMRKYFYDNAGENVLKEQIFVNNKIQIIKEYKYDIKGLKVSAKSVCMYNCKGGAKNSVDSFYYDDNRNLISEKTISEDGKLLEIHTYTYDKRGFRIGEEYKIIAGEAYKSYKIAMTYNGKGYLIQKKTENENGETTEVESVSYDGLDKVISSSRYDMRGTLMRTFFYNVKGLVETEVHTFETDNTNKKNLVWKYEFREEQK
ncbi:MAG: hypothetical protein B6I18_02690 [Bacteroidetes bacterium 4572_112]|nr:MAG: hypothetical protein B6I18_02690 [Bacteroidetes bacterium 4572_112]